MPSVLMFCAIRWMKKEPDNNEKKKNPKMDTAAVVWLPVDLTPTLKMTDEPEAASGASRMQMRQSRRLRPSRSPAAHPSLSSSFSYPSLDSTELKSIRLLSHCIKFKFNSCEIIFKL